MRYASRIECLEDRSLLQTMEFIETDDMISFSGGFPSPETYPVEDIKASFLQVLEQEGKNALSYCSTSGHRPLRELIVRRMADQFDVQYDLSEIIITSGSQQGLDMSGMLFVNKGDVVIFEAPSYLGAVNALRAHESTLVSVSADDEGMDLAELSGALSEYGDRVKMVYVNPDYQNPTGRSWSPARRRDFMELMSRYDIPVLEDAAYSELSFGKALQKPLASFDRKGQVVYIGTFSKIFCPGLRVAWLCARRTLMEKFLVLKNAADLSSSAICQMQMAHYLTHYDLDKHIAEITALYKHRRDLMLHMLETEFPPEVRYTRPEGGLFIWLSLPAGKDARELLVRANKEKIAFIPGGAFYPSAAKNNELRLNFSNMADQETREGMRILGRIVREYFSE